MAASWLRYIWLCWYWAAISGCGTRGDRGVGVGGELEQSVLAPVELREVLGPSVRSDPVEAIMWARIWSRGRKAAILKSLNLNLFTLLFCCCQIDVFCSITKDQLMM